MTQHLHHLRGCAPAPLALYLKAIGILRLIAEQADPDARGWWQDEHFCLLTKLDRGEIESFFLNDYSPTPLLAPWNGGSGFFRTWDAKSGKLRNSKNAAALESLLETNDQRVIQLRLAASEVTTTLPAYCVRTDVSKLSAKERNKLLVLPVGDGPTFPVIPKDDSGKLQVQRTLLRMSRETPFYRSALVEVAENMKGPWLWGSAGNDGNIDYTGRFFENLNLILTPKDVAKNERLLNCSLFEESTHGLLTNAAGKVGQFFPTGAGGPNVTTGPGTQKDTCLNPWDFVLMLEGAVAFSSSTTRRLDPTAIHRSSSPFVVQSHTVRKSTALHEKDERGEQWMPLWNRPACFPDLSALIAEARLQVGRRPAKRPIDAALSIARLGTARGLSGFVRYSFRERNGRSHLAVLLGRIKVKHRPNATLIDNIAPWLDQLQRMSRDKNAPARFVHAEQRLADAVFAVLTHDETSARWQAVLEAAGGIESIQVGDTAIKAGPIPFLSPGWIKAAGTGDGSAEFRLALALGSAARGFPKGRRPIDSVRHHWLPLEPGAFRFSVSDKRLAHDSRVVISGRDPEADCAAIVRRRLIEGERDSARSLPLKAAFGCDARLNDLAALINGEVDLDRVLTLARAFMAIDWKNWSGKEVHSNLPTLPSRDNRPVPDDAWLALRLACLPSLKKSGQASGNVVSKDNITIPAEPSLVSRLLSGDGSEAVRIATRRLGASGIRTPFTSAITDPETARRWAAALAFPISLHSARRAVEILVPDFFGETR